MGSVNKLLVVLGPTATGKTDIALTLAKKYQGELVAADSRQVYKGLDIGTGKLPNNYISLEKHDGYWVVDGVKIWMYDVVDFNSSFSVKDYIEQAISLIEQITQRGKLPIIVGGTGFYIRGLLEGIPNLIIPVDLELRKSLENLGVGELQKKLKLLSPTVLENMNQSDKNNPRRLRRAIELYNMYPYIALEIPFTTLQTNYQVLKVGLTAPLPFLRQKISRRLSNRVSQGLIQEALELQRRGLTGDQMRELGLEYRVLADLIDHKFSEEESIKVLETKIYQFARRQLTWFRKEREVVWFDISQTGFRTKLETVISQWYDTKHRGQKD